MAGIIGFTRTELTEIFNELGYKPPSPKQLHYWAETNVVPVTMVNQKTPIYGFKAVLDLLVFVRLIEIGLTTSTARVVLGGWAGGHCRVHWEQYIGIESSPVRGMTDGENVKPLDDYDLMVMLLDGKTSWHGFSYDPARILDSFLRLIFVRNWQSRLGADEQKFLQRVNP